MTKKLIGLLILLLILLGLFAVVKKAVSPTVSPSLEYPSRADTKPKSEVQSKTIENYVKENISKLSSEKEALGGKFYVTSIEAHGGTGTVHYEDGHIALIADFTYTIDESGRPTVTSFTVRK